MDEYVKALAFALFPAAGNFIGGLLAENFVIPERTFGLALHLAAGVVLAVIAVELVRDALDVESPWITIAAFLAGGVFFLVLDIAVNLVANLSTRTRNTIAAFKRYGIARRTRLFLAAALALRS